MIGAALTAAGQGLGHRRVAGELGVPEDTVRGRLRRAAGRAGELREVFTKVAGRWPRLLTVSPWEIAAAVTDATLLAPVMAAAAFNASYLS